MASPVPLAADYDDGGDDDGGDDDRSRHAANIEHPEQEGQDRSDGNGNSAPADAEDAADGGGPADRGVGQRRVKPALLKLPSGITGGILPRPSRTLPLTLEKLRPWPHMCVCCLLASAHGGV
jgi:hypothetical protein